MSKINTYMVYAFAKCMVLKAQQAWQGQQTAFSFTKQLAHDDQKLTCCLLVGVLLDSLMRLLIDNVVNEISGTRLGCNTWCPRARPVHGRTYPLLHTNLDLVATTHKLTSRSSGLFLLSSPLPPAKEKLQRERMTHSV